MPFGAEVLERGGVRFRLWAPTAREMAVELLSGGERTSVPMRAAADGWFEAAAAEAGPGTRYRYRVDGGRAVPDPASRFQPEGVHGPSEVIDARSYRWRETGWRGRPWQEAVVYELHVGAFTKGGTFGAAAQHLPSLAALGVTAVEVMPVAACPGTRNWGYDGVLPFAPQASYGSPDELRAFVDAAHASGLMVLLDVVYNHFGPEGNYLGLYAKPFFTDRHHTPWGQAIDFDGASSRPVRDFFIHNALYWLEEFRMDGLRLDAVHAIEDDSDPDILEELAAVVQAGPGSDRHVHLVLENYENEAGYLEPRKNGGTYAAQWNDDFHHAAHVLLTGEHNGYYADYARDPVHHLVRCLAEGFSYQGETSAYRGRPRGEPSAALPTCAFINFLQNHDQVGNRARGDRLAVLTEPHKLRALTAIVLLAPAVPALFMGEEFGCERPFLFFCDFVGELGDAVRLGRQRDFARFVALHEGAPELASIPDPNALGTFESSKLDWDEAELRDHATWRDLHARLLALRHRHVVPALSGTSTERVAMLGARAFLVQWRLGNRSALALVANLGDEPVEPAAAAWPTGNAVYCEPSLPAEPAMLRPWSVTWYLDATPPASSRRGSAQSYLSGL
jgi:maltooligosyltrehalose trehalohydrolase